MKIITLFALQTGFLAPTVRFNRAMFVMGFSRSFWPLAGNLHKQFLFSECVWGANTQSWALLVDDSINMNMDNFTLFRLLTKNITK